jgi:hypothetical protein
MNGETVGSSKYSSGGAGPRASDDGDLKVKTETHSHMNKVLVASFISSEVL